MDTKHATNRVDLAQALRDRDLTHRAVGYLVDKSEGTISNWVRGLSPHPKNQEQLVTVLNDAGAKKGLPPLAASDIWGSDG